jgi:hypothetical protein
MKIILAPVSGNAIARVRYERGELTVNGQPFKGDLVTYGEEAGCSTFSDDPAVTFDIVPSSWVNPNKPPEPPPAPLVDMQAIRAEWRAQRWQMILALGEARWAAIMAFADSPEAPWGMRVIIDNAQIIPRLSETIDTLAWVLGMSDDDVDAIFTAAMALEA